MQENINADESLFGSIEGLRTVATYGLPPESASQLDACFDSMLATERDQLVISAIVAALVRRVNSDAPDHGHGSQFAVLDAIRRETVLQAEALLTEYHPADVDPEDESYFVDDVVIAAAEFFGIDEARIEDSIRAHRSKDSELR